MQEREGSVCSGWLMLAVVILVCLAVPIVLAAGIVLSIVPLWASIVLAWLLIAAATLTSWGLFTLQPNEARVLVLFGKYVGTVKKDGFHWANPFSVNRGPWVAGPLLGKEGQVSIHAKHKYRVSLRARNFETQASKVNDQRGNPIEIGAVVVWRIEDTAKALLMEEYYQHSRRGVDKVTALHNAQAYLRTQNEFAHPYYWAGFVLVGDWL